MTDAAATERRPAPRHDEKLTRIPVRHVYFDDSMTFPDIGSGYSTLSNLKCYPESANATRYVLCDWIPSWQMFEFTFHMGGKDEPRIRFVSATHVKSWQREDAAR